MPASTSPEIRFITSGETRNVAVDMTGKLDSGETLTGTPTVTVSPTGPTLSNKAVNTSTLVINGSSVTAGYAIQFKITGATAGTLYTITCTCGTTSTPAQTLVEYVMVQCQDA